MSFETPKNPNYCATIVQIKQENIVPLANCDNVVSALIFGSSIIISKDTAPGTLGLYFPVETALSPEFLKSNNLYRENTENSDTTQKGFFEKHGRVRCVKFRGHKSEGFFIPIESMNFIPSRITFGEGDIFDTVEGHEICRKYVPKSNKVAGVSQERAKQAKLEDSIVDGQFRFHTDTENLRRNAHKISPDDYISISDKWHGTSVVVSKLAVKRKLTWVEKLAQRFGATVQESEYGLVYSSRRVIKAVNGVAKGDNNHFYTSDIWGVVAEEIADRIPDQFTLYGEIVGYTPDGSPIQAGYAYGCAPGAHKFVVYRTTVTTNTGKVIELSWPQLLEFGAKYGFEIVPTLYHGKACGLFPTLDTEDHWNDNFVKLVESAYVYDQDCIYNEPKVPAEGVVVRVDRLQESEALKLKSFAFLSRESKELDKGEVDLETVESTIAEITA